MHTFRQAKYNGTTGFLRVIALKRDPATAWVKIRTSLNHRRE